MSRACDTFVGACIFSWSVAKLSAVVRVDLRLLSVHSCRVDWGMLGKLALQPEGDQSCVAKDCVVKGLQRPAKLTTIACCTYRGVDVDSLGSGVESLPSAKILRLLGIAGGYTG